MSDFIVATALALSAVGFGLVARWYVMPRLTGVAFGAAVTPFLLLHSFRHVGLLFLAPGAVHESLPSAFATPAAYGDLAAALLAFFALAAVRLSWPIALPLVWLFNLEGFVDLLYAVTQGVLNHAASDMGATIWIPTVIVPALLVTHFIVFVLLMRARREAGEISAGRNQGRSISSAVV